MFVHPHTIRNIFLFANIHTFTILRFIYHITHAVVFTTNNDLCAKFKALFQNSAITTYLFVQNKNKNIFVFFGGWRQFYFWLKIWVDFITLENTLSFREYLIFDRSLLFDFRVFCIAKPTKRSLSDFPGTIVENPPL